MVLNRIAGTFESFEYQSGKDLTFQLKIFRSRSIWGAGKINPQKNQELAWVAQGYNLEKCEFGGAMRGVVSRAFDLVPSP